MGAITSARTLINGHQKLCGHTYLDHQDFNAMMVARRFPDHIDLLFSICLESTGSRLDKKNVVVADSNWTGRCVYKFCKRLIRSRSDKEEVDRAFNRNGLKLRTFERIPSQGASALLTLSSICIIAEVCRTPLNEFVDQFLTYCFQELNITDDDAFNKDNSASYADIEFQGDGRKLVNKVRIASTTRKSTLNSGYWVDEKVAEKAKGAIYDRQEIRHTITNFIDSPSHHSGYITLVGGAGVGKSSILATHIQNNFKRKNYHLAWYFLELGSGRNTIYEFLSSLYRQLSSTFDLSKLAERFDNLSAPMSRYRLLLDDTVQLISQQLSSRNDEKLVIVIDALDELDSTDPTSKHNNLNKLGIPITLPPNIYFLISSRSMSRVRLEGNICNIDISDKSDQQRKDIRAYLEDKFKENHIKQWAEQLEWDDQTSPLTQRFTELLEDKSGYTFIYLHYVFADISAYSIASLPSGLTNYYERQYERLVSDADQHVYSKKLILALLSRFPPSLSATVISEFSGLEHEHLNAVTNAWLLTRLISSTLRDDVLYLSLFHTSFLEFLTDKSTVAYSEITTITGMREAYMRLAAYIAEHLSADTDQLNIDNNLTTGQTDELFRLVLDVFKRARGDYILKLADLLTVGHFYDKQAEVDKKSGTARTLDCLAFVYEALLKSDQAKASQLLQDFYFKVTKRDGSGSLQQDTAVQFFEPLSKRNASSIGDAYEDLRLQATINSRDSL